MREIVKVSNKQEVTEFKREFQDEDKDAKKKGKRRKGKCIDTIIDGR